MVEERWDAGINQESLNKAVSVGEILPPLALPTIPAGKTNSAETLYVKFVKNPQLVKNEKLPFGDTYFAEVESQGARRSLIIPESLRFNLAKECKVHNLKEPAGNFFVIGASISDIKATATRAGRKGVKMYWAQHKKPGEIVEQEITGEIKVTVPDNVEEFA